MGVIPSEESQVGQSVAVSTDVVNATAGSYSATAYAESCVDAPGGNYVEICGHLYQEHGDPFDLDPLGAGIIYTEYPNGDSNLEILQLGLTHTSNVSSVKPNWDQPDCSATRTLELDLEAEFTSIINAGCLPDSRILGFGLFIRLVVTSTHTNGTTSNQIVPGVLALRSGPSGDEWTQLGVFEGIPSSGTTIDQIIQIPLDDPGLVSSVKLEPVLIPFQVGDGDLDGNGCVDDADLVSISNLAFPATGSMIGTSIESAEYSAQADFDLNGIIDGADVHLFLEAYRLRADLNQDGVVNASDLAIMMANWGPCVSAPCTGDLDCSGVVDSADAMRLLNSQD